MTDTQITEHVPYTQGINPTPVEIRTAIYEALIRDDKDASTPAIPAHVTGLVRRAIEDANAGVYR